MEKLSKAPVAFLLRTYVNLTKPGIIMGNSLTAAAGFSLASIETFNFGLFLAMLEGLALIIASACVFNNYIDRELDGKMERTKNRPLVLGYVSPKAAIIYAIMLGLLGTLILALFTNLLTVCIALLGVFVYVIAYSFLKYYTTYGTLVGSIAGAVPPVVGYCAVTNYFDRGALLLFIMIVMWQMPHFYAIAIRRLKDYANASIPVHPVKKGVRSTKVHMFFYIVAFMLTPILLTFFGYTGYLFLGVLTFLSLVWLIMCLKGFKASCDKIWARQMFIFSLVIVMAICVVIPFSVC